MPNRKVRILVDANFFWHLDEAKNHVRRREEFQEFRSLEHLLRGDETPKLKAIAQTFVKFLKRIEPTHDREVEARVQNITDVHKLLQVLHKHDLIEVVVPTVIQCEIKHIQRAEDMSYVRDFKQ